MRACKFVQRVQAYGMLDERCDVLSVTFPKALSPVLDRSGEEGQGLRAVSIQQVQDTQVVKGNAEVRFEVDGLSWILGTGIGLARLQGFLKVRVVRKDDIFVQFEGLVDFVVFQVLQRSLLCGTHAAESAGHPAFVQVHGQGRSLRRTAWRRFALLASQTAQMASHVTASPDGILDASCPCRLLRLFRWQAVLVEERQCHVALGNSEHAVHGVNEHRDGVWIDRFLGFAAC
mmetsp:Transcript_20870/g.59521  ORF Transcript_20870/g.59521 Transcript_20870/m.59521 type:complete len:231 (+) Transcript_20870:1412-2104(+)